MTDPDELVICPADEAQKERENRWANAADTCDANVDMSAICNDASDCAGQLKRRR